MTMVATATPVLQGLLAIPRLEPRDRYPIGECPDWCTNDHIAAGGFVKARRHDSDFFYIAKRTGHGVEFDRGSLNHPQLCLHLTQSELRAKPSIVIRENSAEAGRDYDDDGEFHGRPIIIELDEAMTIAQALVELVDVAMGVARAPRSEEESI